MTVILYQGHGSFRFTTSGSRVFYVDPYAGSGYDLPADAILVTHEHRDHNAVELVPKKSGVRICRAAEFLAEGEYTSKEVCGVKITAVPACNRNHPVDRCVGFVVETEGKKIYFSGDTSKTSAMGTVLRDMQIDCAFFPTDGIYNMNAKEASECARLVGAKASYPVHTAPGKLFDEKIAARFDCPGKAIVRPGEEIVL